MPHLKTIILSLFLVILCITVKSQTQELNIGVATADITPVLPVALDGQMYLRIAQTAETPLMASVVVLESHQGSSLTELVVFVSCELVTIPLELLAMVRNEVHQSLPELDVNKIVMNAVHVHTAPVVRTDIYPLPKDITQVKDYYDFFAKRVTEAIIQAWKNRRPGSVSWGLCHASVAYNRRAVYADGSSKMYGNANLPEFLNLEGLEDHDINSLFFWDKSGKLIAMNINVPCPAQEVEGRTAINADYWYPVREKLKQRFCYDLVVLGWIGAAGDQSPRPLYRKASEERMVKLRNISRLDEIAMCIVLSVEEAYETVKDDRYANAEFIHKAETLTLPMRLVTEAENENSKIEQTKINEQIAADPKANDRVFRKLKWEGDVNRRFEEQKINPRPMYEMEIHVIRIGGCGYMYQFF